ncbi:PRAME family member 8-like [Bos taurus]|uniref:PRAME family member 8-like n=1 Tax=Bos taurus TaxID=9913 RepID=UPI000383FB2E|nr:PRAME family member 8-like [Bos taurus]
MHLIREDALVCSALEFLPTELLPLLFMDAFHGRHIKTLKAMVQAWPFVCLPLGGLIDLPHVGPLQAILEVLDVLLAQKVCSKWMEQRKASIHLCCKKLTIFAMPVENVMKILNTVQLDCIQEVQFLKQYHLQDLYLDSPSFLEGCLDQMLRFLRTLLDHLAITNCWLTESDLTHLSQCPNIHELKGLDLSGITMTDFSPKILHILLEQVAATLKELNLEQCGITESRLESILPVLSCCSQLRTFSLCRNVLYMPIMEKLLSHTTGLFYLSDEFYPAPQEGYSPHGILHLG